MKSNLFFLLFAFTLLTVTGCVSTKQHKSLQASYAQLQKDFAASQMDAQQCKSDLASAQTRIASLNELIQSQQNNVAALQSALDKCLASSNQGNVNISKLVDEINSANAYIKHLVNVKNTNDSLNLVLTSNLTRSLSRDELKDVDVQVLKGVVYISLADNMLYKSGSYEISEKANASLAKIAKILQDYKDFEVLVEGNTDDVPINRPNIRNNWDLSALRASSVVQALQVQFGVDPKRMTAGGRGEFNPIVSNSTPEGKTRNRRTQLIITPKLDQFMELIDKAPEGSGKK